jgi:iron donor protein CyaY
MPLVLFDTNIFIDAMLGHAVAEKVLSAYANSATSFITYIELMAGAKTPSEVLRVVAILSPLEVLQRRVQAQRQELWVAAKSGGFHYKRVGADWINTRDGSELFAALSQLASAQGNAQITL